MFCDEAAKTARAGDVMAVAEPLVAALIDPDERQIPTLVKQSGATAGEEEEGGGLEGEPTRGGAIGTEPEEISAVNANDASALLQVTSPAPFSRSCDFFW